MTEQQNTRTVRVRVVHRDGATGNLRDALARPQAPALRRLTVAEQVAQEKAQK